MKWILSRSVATQRNSCLMKSNNMIDFAGSGIVHMVGGFSGLMGAYFLGPRKGRFDKDGSVIEKPGHNTLLAVLGVLING